MHHIVHFQIEEIDLPYDKIKNQRRAFCFITFESEEVVDKVCEQLKQEIAHKEVRAKPICFALKASKAICWWFINYNSLSLFSLQVTYLWA